MNLNANHLIRNEVSAQTREAPSLPELTYLIARSFHGESVSCLAVPLRSKFCETTPRLLNNLWVDRSDVICLTRVVLKVV